MRMLRQIVSNGPRMLPSIRPMSTAAGPLVDLDLDNDGIAVLTMQRSPVNALNLEMLQALGRSFDDMRRSTAVKGLVLTSALPTVFSAGLDLREMYKPDIKRAETFFLTLQEVWIKLFGSNFITAAAINGHAPAGGCLLSLSCEYRTMVSGEFTIGLNETVLGIVASSWFMDTMRHTVSTRQAELALTSGKMFTVDEALKVGLIDDLATDNGDAIEQCKQFIRRFDKIPPFARALTKQAIREAPLRRLRENRQKDKDSAIEFIVKNANTQNEIGMYLDKLQNRNSK